jgi:DNA replication protein DnaC
MSEFANPDSARPYADEARAHLKRAVAENPAEEEWTREEWHCERCHDTTFINLGTDADGVRLGVKRCECFQENSARKHNDRLLPRARIPARYAACTHFDTFVLPPHPHPSRDPLQQIFGILKSYVTNFSPQMTGPRGVLIYGANGVGKTHLAVVALRLILAKGYEGRFINYQALLRLIKAGYDQPFGSVRTAAFDDVADVEVLLLDDVGSNRVTDWVQDTITELIAHRYDNQKATIITSNYTVLSEKDSPFPSLADRIGVRAASRLCEMCRPLCMPALPDYRTLRIGQR